MRGDLHFFRGGGDGSPTRPALALFESRLSFLMPLEWLALEVQAYTFSVLFPCGCGFPDHPVTTFRLRSQPA